MGSQTILLKIIFDIQEEIRTLSITYETKKDI